MKVIIAGGRDIFDMRHIIEAIQKSGFEITEVVSGGASGVDTLGEVWAKQNKIKLSVFPADWETRGRSAGPIRNMQMATYADSLIAVWNGKSRGTKNMIDTANKKGIPVYSHRI